MLLSLSRKLGLVFTEAASLTQKPRHLLDRQALGLRGHDEEDVGDDQACAVDANGVVDHREAMNHGEVCDILWKISRALDRALVPTLTPSD